ncbi:MAG: nitroreductase [Pseudomonadota bacterium]
MDVYDAVRGRRSTRAFLPRPVPRDVLERVIDTARRAPSWSNTQPWELLIVSGEPLRKIGLEFRERVAQGEKEHPDFPMPSEWEEPFKSRAFQTGKGLFDILGVAREDKAARAEHYQRMYSFFGAPHLILVLMDERLGHYSLFDCGSITQTICLLAAREGLGTCILAAAVRHPDILRKHLPLPPHRKFVMGIATGYPDPTSAYNRYRSARVTLQEFTTWVDK